MADRDATPERGQASIAQSDAHMLDEASRNAVGHEGDGAPLMSGRTFPLTVEADTAGVVEGGVGVGSCHSPEHNDAPVGSGDEGSGGSGKGAGVLSSRVDSAAAATGGGGGGGAGSVGVGGGVGYGPAGGVKSASPPGFPYMDEGAGGGRGGWGGGGKGGGGGGGGAGRGGGGAFDVHGGGGGAGRFGGGEGGTQHFGGLQQQQQRQQHLDAAANAGGGVGGLHGIMPSSPYSGPQRLPDTVGAQVPQAALLGGPLTSAKMKNYQQNSRRLRQLPPVLDARLERERGSLGGVEPSYLGGGGAVGDGSYIPGGQQAIGGQESYVLDPRYPQNLQPPRGPTAYAGPLATYAQEQASPMLGARRHHDERTSGKGGSVSRDREILCILFNATNNAKKGEEVYSQGEQKILFQDGWTLKDGWKSCKAMGEWHGVTTNAEGRVIGLELEDNCLKGIIPPQLGDLDALDQLNLGKNELTDGIPKELGKLQALKKLDLSFNGTLGGVISPELGGLKALEELDLVQCALEGSIPSELGKLQALKTLNLYRNRSLGGVIPPELGDLKALEVLNISQCALEGCVPPQLWNLQAVREIYINKNNLTGIWDHTQDASRGQGAQDTPGRCIPSQLRRLLEFLSKMEGQGGFISCPNPWAEPPEVVMSLGMAAVVAYFDALYSSPCRVRRNSVKVVLVGQEGAGKTSLRQSMKTGRATPTDGPIESTVFADVETLEVNGASVRVYDCAGQVAYTGMLQMFLTPRAVCLVVCDAGAFGQLDSGVDDQLDKDVGVLENLRVCDWMRSISRRVPQNDVVLVATKCDLAGGNAAYIAGRMDAACRTWLADWARAGMEPVRLEKGVCLTSCCARASNEQEEVKSGKRMRGQSWECDWREYMTGEPPPSMLHRVVNKSDGNGRRGAAMVLPHSWDIALTVLEALENGRDPAEAVVQRSAEPRAEVERKTEPFKGITVKELNARWEAAVVDLSKKGIDVINRGHALEGALSIREFEGTLVRHETFLFLDVVWLARILKPLLNHKDSARRDGSVFLGNTGDKDIVLTEIRHIDSWKRLKEEGVLEPALAGVMWPDLFEYVMPTLAFLGLTFPLDLDPAEGLVVLLRLGTDRPKSVGEDIDKFCVKHSAVFDVCWDLFLGVPPGVIEKVLTRCCSIGAVQTFWRFGVLVKGTLNGSEGSGSFALVLEYSCDSTQLDLRIYGDICTVAPWAALSYAISAVRTMAAEFPGLRSRASMECPEDGHDTRMTITTSGPGEELLQGGGCSRCSRETGGIGAAAFELVRLVDVREARGVMFRELNARFVGVQPYYDSLRPKGLRELPSDQSMIEQIKAAHEALLTDMEEYRALRYVHASATSGPHGQNELCQYLKSISLAMDDIRGRLGGDNHDVLGAVEGALARIEGLVGADDGVMGRLDFLVTMLMAVRGDKVDTPRQACVLPGDYAESPGLWSELRKPEVWTRALEDWSESDFAAGKGVWKKKMRLFLICAHTHQLVPCGHNGRGYDVEHYRKWVRMTVDVAKFALQLLFATLGAMTLAQLPETVLGAAGEQTVEAALSGVRQRLEGIVLEEEVQTLRGNPYKCLRTFVHEMEDTARVSISDATKKAHKERRAPPSTSKFVYFEEVMSKVQPRAGDGEAQWVLKGHEQAWYDAARNSPTG